MLQFLEVLKYVLPSVVTLLASYFTVKKFLEAEHQKKLDEIRQQHEKQLSPVRLQAYERLVLLMERISITSMVMRLHKPGMSARMLQSEMIKSIRTEFDHNVTQQLYVTNKVWDTMKTAREETVKAINIASAKLPDGASGVDLVNTLYELITKVDKLPNEIALDMLKMEARQLF
jgi:hypothetical protein